MSSGRRPDFIGRAMKFEEMEKHLTITCSHEDEAHEKGEVFECKNEDCSLQKYIDEDELMDLKFYRVFRERIPFDDPLWREFGPQFVRNWIDYTFYYGPHAHIEEEDLLHDETVMNSDLFTRFTSMTKLRKETYFVDGFRPFMRKKLSELMGDKWISRLENPFHKDRDIERDNLRYRYETGKFDPTTFVPDEDDEDWWSDPKKVEEYLAWD